MKKMKRLMLLSVILSCFLLSTAAFADTITLDPVSDLGTWESFGFVGAGSTADTDFQFTLTSALSLYVTDAYMIGDIFDIYNDDTLIGSTTYVAPTGDFVAGEGQEAYDSGSYSRGEFYLAPGDYNIHLVVSASPFGSGGAFLKLDTPTINPTPEPSTMLLLGCGMVGLAGIARKKMRK